MSDLVADKPRSILPTLEFDGTATPAKTVLFLVLCICWIMPGLIGHEPWKPEEAQTFGVIYDMVKSGNYVVPTLAGEVYLDKPPLYYWSAVIFAKLLSPMLPMHDAARLVTGGYMGLSLFFVALTGVMLFGPRFGRVSALILVGSFGPLINAHAMVVDVALLTGTAVAVFGLAILLARPTAGGAVFGTGIGIAFLAKGLVALAMLLPVGLALPLMFETWRRAHWRRSLAAAGLALLPWLILWPVALYRRSPQLFGEWLWLQEWAPFAEGPSAWLDRLANLASVLPWYAWPALLVAGSGLWYARGSLQKEPGMQLLTVLLVTQLVGIALFGEKREVQAMPLLVPLTLFAARGIDSLRRGAASALDWFGVMTFGLTSALLWLGWIAMLTGVPKFAVEQLQKYFPGFEARFSLMPFLLALTLTIVWLIAITRSRQSNRRAIVNWAAGIAMFWMLSMTLWLPYIDQGKSYRATVGSIAKAIPARADCVASRGLGEPQRAMLDYYIDLRTVRLERTATNNCKVLLVQGRASDPPKMDKPWKEIWQGARPGDYVERFWLYRR